MAFYFRTDRDFNIFNLASNVVPTNGISVYIAGTPGSNRIYSEENRLEVYFDGVFHKRFQVLEVEDSDGGKRNGGDLSCSVATTGTSMIYTINPIKIPDDAQTMLLKAWVFRSGEIQTYERLFTFNVPPEISGSDMNLGVKNSAFTVEFTVNDANPSDVLSVACSLNDKIIYENTNINRDEQYSVEITNAMLSELGLGDRNEIILEVSDARSVVKRVYTFTKEVDLDAYCEYVTNPIMLASRPTCITVGQAISSSKPVEVKVYVTNNALDNSPKWEDMSEEYRKGSVHYFSNKVCASDNYAIALRFVNAKEDVADKITTSGFGFITDVTIIGDDGLPRQLSGFVTNYVSGNSHKLTWQNPNKNFTGTKIVRAKNSDVMNEMGGDVVYNGTGTSFSDTLPAFDSTYFDPEVYWTMIDNKDYSYWTNVALYKPSGKIVDGDTFVYRKFPYGGNGTQTQEYNGVVNVVVRGVNYPYPEGSITVDKTYSAGHGSIDIPILDHVPGNTVHFSCTKDSKRREIIKGEFVEESGVLRFNALRPGISEITAHTGALATETKAFIRVCDRLHLRINTIPYTIYGGERTLVTYNVTNSLNENLTDKCMLHYASESNTIDEGFEVNVLGGGNAEIILNGDNTNSAILSKYHFWVEIDGNNYEEESKIYLRSYGIEV